MKTSLIVIGLLLVGAVFATKDYIIPHSWKYKITIAVDTPEGVVTGRAVRKISTRLGIPLTPESLPIHYNVKGEAIVVDLGERGVIFGTISSGAYEEVEDAFPYRGRKDIKKINYYDGLDVDESAPLPVGSWPQMVTFADMKDPKTVRRVLMVSRCNEKDIAVGKCAADREGKFAITENHLEDYFGQGVSIKSITVEITDDPVTQGVVDRYLPKEFWQKYGQWMRSMNIQERGRVLSPSKDYFKKGIE